MRANSMVATLLAVTKSCMSCRKPIDDFLAIIKRSCYMYLRELGHMQNGLCTFHSCNSSGSHHQSQSIACAGPWLHCPTNAPKSNEKKAGFLNPPGRYPCSHEAWKNNWKQVGLEGVFVDLTRLFFGICDGHVTTCPSHSNSLMSTRSKDNRRPIYSRLSAVRLGCPDHHAS